MRRAGVDVTPDSVPHDLAVFVRVQHPAGLARPASGQNILRDVLVHSGQIGDVVPTLHRVPIILRVPSQHVDAQKLGSRQPDNRTHDLLGCEPLAGLLEFRPL